VRRPRRGTADATPAAQAQATVDSPDGDTRRIHGLGRTLGQTTVRVTIDADPPMIVDVEPDGGPSRVSGPTDPSVPAPALHGSRAPGRPLVHALSAAPWQASGAAWVEVVVDGWRFVAMVEPARRAALRDLARREHATAGSSPRVLRAPLPGRIVRIWVRAGDPVEAGARLCSLEAMKMENEILATGAGTIERVSVEPGARVEQGDELVVIA